MKKLAIVLLMVALQACGGSSDSSGAAGSASTLDFSSGFPSGTYVMSAGGLDCYGAVDSTAQMELVVNGSSITESVTNLNGCNFVRTGSLVQTHTSGSGVFEMEYEYTTLTSSSGNCVSDYQTATGQASWTGIGINFGEQSYDAPTASGSTVTLKSTDLCGFEPINNSPTGSAVITFIKQ